MFRQISIDSSFVDGFLSYNIKMHLRNWQNNRFESQSERIPALKLFFYVLILLLSTKVQGIFASDEPNYANYAIACPFFTIMDSISEAELRELWQNGTSVAGKLASLSMTQDTYEDVKSVLGDDPSHLITIRSEKVIRTLLSGKSSALCAIVPVNELQGNWKRIAIDGSAAPWDKSYQPKSDLLAIPAQTQEKQYNPNESTTVLLTGTTALTRTTAVKMVEHGVTYPGEKIRSVFEDADIRHISNESAFWSLCPQPVLEVTTMQFCSSVEAIELLAYLGVNVVELSGNHLRDYDWPPLLETFDLLEEKNIGYYAAGRNELEAASPYKMEVNGNRFAFLGCNIAGPDHVYVDDKLPGVSRCDFDKMVLDIKDLRAEGYQVIVTLQYYETYSRVPTAQQELDFQRLSDAGAVIVSGSQAHLSQTMKPFADRFIHYGLGNLFFDQMDRPVQGTRQEFLDRYVFYQGKLIQVELITALLEDYAQPVLMNQADRQNFLNEIFSYVQ